MLAPPGELAPPPWGNPGSATGPPGQRPPSDGQTNTYENITLVCGW